MDISEDKIVPIVYSANKKVSEGVILSALSVAYRCSRPVRVYVLTMDLPEMDARYTSIAEETVKKLDGALKTVNGLNEAVRVDVTELFKRELSDSKNLKSKFTPYAMLRLLVDLLDMPDRAIYLDVDTMCCSDISLLYDIDIEDYEFAAVLDKVGHIYVRPRYCNTGVLYCNLKNVRETRLFERARQMVRKRKLFMPDQSSLNFLVKKKLILPYRFNEQRQIKEDTVIKHLCRYFKWYGPFFRLKNVKQWERDKVHEVLGITTFDDIYELYDKLDKIYDFGAE